jgi:hypothetical protein
VAETLDAAALGELQRLHEAATPVPWDVAPDRPLAAEATVYGPDGDGLAICVGSLQIDRPIGSAPQDASLIAAFRNAFPDLLRLARLGLEHERLAGILATLETDIDAALDRAAMAQKRTPKGDADAS